MVYSRQVYALSHDGQRRKRLKNHSIPKDLFGKCDTPAPALQECGPLPRGASIPTGVALTYAYQTPR
jgi:hypothetical protein